MEDTGKMADTGNQKYNRRVALVLGILGLVIGVLCIFVQIPAYTEDLESWKILSSGIWTGVFFLITGAMTLASWRKPANGLIIAVMVLSILSCLVAFTGIIMYLMVWIVDAIITYGMQGRVYKVTMAVSTLHLIMFMIEAVSNIVMSAFCCRAVCCGASEEIAVIYIDTHQSAGPQPYAVSGVADDFAPNKS